MKLLLDQNLSFKLVGHLADIFPDSVHVRDVGLASAPDPKVWSFAKTNHFVITSKDTDFQQRALLYGHPPKVIWIRLGNCSTLTVAALMRSRSTEINEFEIDPDASFLALS